MVLTSKHPDLVIPAVDFYKYNIDRLKPHENKVALVDSATNRQLTFREIHHGSIKLASALTKFGVKKQDVVALCSSNCIEYSLIILGIAACNAITTTCNPRYTEREIQRQFSNCQPKVVFTDSDQVEKILAIAKKVPSIQQVISVDPSPRCPSLWSVIEKDDGNGFPFDVSFNVHEDVLFILYSSGTTGLPKGVMLTHQNSIAIATIFDGLNSTVPFAVKYNVTPMFHIYGVNRLFTNFIGHKFIVEKRFNLENLFKAVEKHKVTSFSAVPAMLQQISDSPLLNKYDLSSLSAFTSGGAPLAPQIVSKTMKTTKALISSGWGLTESGGLCAVGRFSSMPLNSVGLLVANYSLKVVDQVTRRELGANEDGELLIKGPGVMKGYFKNPDATAASFEDGWLRTGDVGHYDENGWIYLVDRMKELIKYKAFQVAPAELESLLLSHPKVRDAGVTGVPDPEAGEVPRAFVVKRDASLTEEELHRFIEGKVSRYKYLRGGVYFLDEIPRSAAGKILRRNLKQLQVKRRAKL